MAINNPRIYLALAFPAAVLVLTYMWLKKQRDKDSSSEPIEDKDVFEDKVKVPAEKETICEATMVKKNFNEASSVCGALNPVDELQVSSSYVEEQLCCAKPTVEYSSECVKSSEIEETAVVETLPEAMTDLAIEPSEVVEVFASQTEEVVSSSPKSHCHDSDERTEVVEQELECSDVADEAKEVLPDVLSHVSGDDSTDKIDAAGDQNEILSNVSHEQNSCEEEAKQQPMEAKTNKSGGDVPDKSPGKSASNDDQSENAGGVQSTCSDAQSEGSSDSGKGGSEINSSHDNSTNNSQPNSPLNSDPIIVYEFEIPQELCGRLIGRQGKQINQIRAKSRCNIYIRKIPCNEDTQICVIEGLQSEIDVALEQIRNVFPLKKYPLITLARVNAALVAGMSVPQTIQLNLPDGVPSDVILSSMVNAGHFFVQQPTHPTYPSLSRLDQCMAACYNQLDTPPLPTPIEPGMICAAPMMDGWYRAQIMFVDEDNEECSLKFVDYGGYSQVNLSTLRQIRSDFMPLPFQAAECYLANVAPKNEAEGFSVEACALFEELAQGQILQLQIVGYAEDGLPCVNLYRVQGISNVYINQELCRRGVGKWIEDQAS